MCRPFGFLLSKKIGKYLSAYEETKVYLAKECCTERVRELKGSGINIIVSLMVVIMHIRLGYTPLRRIFVPHPPT